MIYLSPSLVYSILVTAIMNFCIFVTEVIDVSDRK